MVAGRKSNHPSSPLLGRELDERVVGSAELERPCPLEILALENHTRVDRFVDCPRGQDGCPVHDVSNAFMGGDNVAVTNGKIAQPFFTRFRSDTLVTVSS